MTHIALPDDLAELTGENDLDRYVFQLIVLDLFRRGKLSAGKSSEILRLARAEFMELADRHEIPIVNYPAEDAHRELGRWEKHRLPLEPGA